MSAQQKNLNFKQIVYKIKMRALPRLSIVKIKDTNAWEYMSGTNLRDDLNCRNEL
jgi:hypothetical protein